MSANDPKRTLVPKQNTAVGGQLFEPFKFDLDQIQNRRALTIVNSGLALCETGGPRRAP